LDADDEDGISAFAKQLNKILELPLSEYNSINPILSKARATEHKVDKRKRQEKVESALRRERKRRRNKDHFYPDITERSYEKRLVQIATKGVVHLFNSIKKQQKLDKDIANSTSSSSKAEKLTQTSFFELLTKKKAK